MDNSCVLGKILSSAVRLTGILFITAILLAVTDKPAEPVEISSSLNPVGSGARALGMGGAFIATADDATAASWNPAGLVQLERPEFSVVHGYSNRVQNYSSSTHPELEHGDQNTYANGINYASVVYPFTLFKKNTVVSLNYQRLFDMNRNSTVFYNYDYGNGDMFFDTIDICQTGYLATITPALAIRVMPDFYWGLAINFWDDFLGLGGWEMNYSSSGSGSMAGVPFTNSILAKDRYSFTGVNITTGFLLHLNKLTIGGVYKSPFTADLDYTRTETQFGTFNPTPTPAEDHKLLKMQMPLVIGLGLAYRFNDRWTIGLDVNWTQWSKYLIRQEEGDETNPITAKSISEGCLNDTTQVRLGAEYLFIMEESAIPVRAGFFYDPEPGANRIDEFFGFALGSGYTYRHYSFDIVYQYRQGRNVTGDIPVEGVSANIIHHAILTSLIYRF